MTAQQSPGESYSAVASLKEEIARFKRTNTFNPLQVTNLYIQAAVVVAENERLIAQVQTLTGQVASLDAEYRRIDTEHRRLLAKLDERP